MLVVVSGFQSEVNAYYWGDRQKRQQDDDLLISTDPSTSSQEVVSPSSLTDPDVSELADPPSLIAAFEVDVISSSPLTDGDDRKRPEYLIEYESKRDEKGYHYRYV